MYWYMVIISIHFQCRELSFDESIYLMRLSVAWNNNKARLVCICSFESLKSLSNLTLMVTVYEPRLANLCLRAFRHDKFNCACPAIQRGRGSGFLSDGSS